MRKVNGFVCFTLMLLAAMSGSASAGVAQERASTVTWEDESMEALCFPTDDGQQDAVCVTLYADDDGYELCVSGETAGTERCVSSYRFGDPDGSKDDNPEDSRWGVVNL